MQRLPKLVKILMLYLRFDEYKDLNRPSLWKVEGNIYTIFLNSYLLNTIWRKVEVTKKT